MITSKYLRKYFIKYLWLYILGAIALIAVDIIQVRVPFYLGVITDLFSSPITDVVKSDIVWNCLIILFIGIAMFVGRIIWRFTIFKASQKIEADIRHDMFLKAEKLPIDYYHENSVGTVMAWFTSDLETIEECMGFGFIMLIDAIFLSVFTLVSMFIACWQLSLIALIPMTLIIFWGALVEHFISKKWEERQKENDRLYDFSQESFTGIQVIKAFVKENQEIHAFSKIAKKNQDVNVSFGKMSVLFDVLIEIIIVILLTLILSFGGWFVYSAVTGNPIIMFGGPIALKTGGEFFTFVGYFDILIWPLIALGQVVGMLSRAGSSLKRITVFIDTREDVVNPANPIILDNVQGGITFSHFSFTYKGKLTPSLQDITLEVKPGEKIGIVGKIGCGKSTLVNVLLRLYNIEENQIFIDGKDLSKCDITSTRNAIAYVPQDNFLFSDTIQNNIAFSNKKMDLQTVRNAAYFSDIDEDIMGFEKGYNTVSGERGVSLSGGQKQRISIARAFAKSAPIMIMDDSVSAVDVETEENILHNISTFRKDMTTIVIASRISTVAHFDKILVLNEGKVEAFGSHKDLLTTSPAYQRMVKLQELENEVEGGI